MAVENAELVSVNLRFSERNGKQFQPRAKPSFAWC